MSICTNEDEVHKLLSHQKINTPTGPDGISGQMLQETAPSKTLSKIFNISLTQGKIPTAWKASNINPIPKSKDISQCSNYRSISLLSLPSNILERIIHARISSFLSDHNLLSRIQFGFRSRCSTQEALLRSTLGTLYALQTQTSSCSLPWHQKSFRLRSPPSTYPSTSLYRYSRPIPELARDYLLLAFNCAFFVFPLLA